MSLQLRPRTDADLRWEWHWTYEVPDAEWRRWDAPYFHTPQQPLSYADFISRPRLSTRNRRIIDVDGSPVGFVTRFEEEPRGGGWWDLGIVIYDPADWGRRLGRAALIQWTDLTFEETDAHVCTLTTWSGNERMIRSGEACGFRECARIPQARAWAGRRYDSVKLARLRPGSQPDHILST